jgi:hypothetical protein
VLIVLTKASTSASNKLPFVNSSTCFLTSNTVYEYGLAEPVSLHDHLRTIFLRRQQFLDFIRDTLDHCTDNSPQPQRVDRSIRGSLRPPALGIDRKSIRRSPRWGSRIESCRIPGVSAHGDSLTSCWDEDSEFAEHRGDKSHDCSNSPLMPNRLL